MVNKTFSKITQAIFCAVAAFAMTLPTPRIMQAADAPPPAAKEGKEKTELHHRMKEMDDAMKKLRRTLKSADTNADSLDLIAKIEQLAVTCKSMTPSKAATLPEADRPKFIASYRKEMAGLLTEVCKMESAVLDGDNAKAQEIFANLKEMEDKGHDKFNEDDEKK